MTRLKPTIILAALILGTFLVLPGTAQNYAWVLVNGLPFGPGFEITGPGKFADGTASAPSMTFANDSDVGFWRNGSNQFSWTLNGFAYGLFHSIDGLVLHNTTPMSWASG